MRLPRWLRSWRLYAGVVVYRCGWSALALVIAGICTAIVQWAIVWPTQTRAGELRWQAARVDPDLAAPVQQPAAPRGALHALQAVLPPEEQINRQLSRLFRNAAREGLRLDRSSLQYESVTGLPWRHVSISLPVRGSYPAVRRFVEVTLREEPNMALDQLSIEREDLTQAQAEVQIGFSAWFAAEMGRADGRRGSIR